MEEKRCPLCGQENHCGVVNGKKDCWCMTESFPKEILEVAPKDQCICQKCLDTYNKDYSLRP
ncbi:cysteine-rich CWC family protein [Lysinibacillus sp. JNUCC 51]|uniref:cysteine-rich CWC family protein n=1 Tax=Lysinibacillus sp. JNUCC-51 TaxID=2792479 RepID=UPI001936355C|nr:cysteine-rich CWC family protein [Lysinibacillus sp. JNUCC-51]